MSPHESDSSGLSGSLVCMCKPTLLNMKLLSTSWAVFHIAKLGIPYWWHDNRWFGLTTSWDTNAVFCKNESFLSDVNMRESCQMKHTKRYEIVCSQQQSASPLWSTLSTESTAQDVTKPVENVYKMNETAPMLKMNAQIHRQDCSRAMWCENETNQMIGRTTTTTQWINATQNESINCKTAEKSKDVIENKEPIVEAENTSTQYTSNVAIEADWKWPTMLAKTMKSPTTDQKWPACPHALHISRDTFCDMSASDSPKLCALVANFA